MDTEVTPENIASFSYKFTLETHGGRGDNPATFILTVETKEERIMPDLTTFQLTVSKGGKFLMFTQLESVKEKQKIVVSQFQLSPEMLDGAILEFAISSKGVPSGGGFTFPLKKFVKP